MAESPPWGRCEREPTYHPPLRWAEKQVHSIWGDWYLSATHRDAVTKAGKTVEGTLARTGQMAAYLKEERDVKEETWVNGLDLDTDFQNVRLRQCPSNETVGSQTPEVEVHCVPSTLSYHNVLQCLSHRNDYQDMTRIFQRLFHPAGEKSLGGAPSVPVSLSFFSPGCCSW